MMMMIQNRAVMLLLLCFIALKTVAQPMHRAVVPAVEVDGFYAIDLPVLLLGIAAPDKRDIRIQSGAGKEVAWLLQQSVEQKHVNELIPFQTKIKSTNHQTEVVIEANKDPLSSFILLVKNAEIQKVASLQGSNDAQKWFAVKDKVDLKHTGISSSTEVFLNIDFPLSDYAFYKLSINDSLTAPLNIVKIVTLKDEYAYRQNTMEIPQQACSITKDGKKTAIKVVLPFKYKVSDLSFYISSPMYFNRTLRTGVTSSSTLASNDSTQVGKPLDIKCTQYTDTLSMSIYNGDDQPLSIDSIKAYTHKSYIVAALKAGESYSLTFGDQKRSFPQYDLSFSTQLPDSIQHISITNMQKLPATDATEEESRWMALLKKYGLWIIIGFVILQILYMVRKMA
jgi:hypothetical protein